MASKKPTLVVMAAGMGSRYGGLKQVDPVGPNGEGLLEFAVYDALAAGFGRAVFVIKKSIEELFKKNIGDHLAKHIPVSYVYQELDAIPEGFTVPAGRTKPWGTGHAVLCCHGIVNEPFMVINADDYYGQECYGLLAEYLSRPQTDGKLHIAMAGYELGNTLTENGYVSRGVCTTDETGRLVSLVERTRIERHGDRAEYTEDDGKTWTELPFHTPVSMNCWAFPEGTLDHFYALFEEFMRTDAVEKPEKSEFYLPFAVNSLIEEGKADVQVLRTRDRWYGMTYHSDREQVAEALKAFTAEGRYPDPLWK